MRRLLIFLCVTGIAWQATAESVSLPTLRDATLIESPDGLLANGAGPVLFAGRTGQLEASRRRSLLLFDVAGALPGGARVTGAWLELSLTPSNLQPVALGLHRGFAAWGEGAAAASGGSGAPATPGDSTWIHRFYATEAWASPGGDFAPAPSAVSVVGEAGPATWGSTPTLVANVQGWLDAPASNHGWILLGGEDAPSTAKRFESRETADPMARPQLVLEFQGACEAAGLRGAAFGACNAYCEAIDCDSESPHGSVGACDRLALQFARASGGAPLPCELPDGDGDGVHDGADNCPSEPNPGQADTFGTIGVGDDCDCECFTVFDVAALIAELQDPSVYTEIACFDTRPSKPLTALVALRLDGTPCGAKSHDCSAIAVAFTEDNACQFNPTAPDEPTEAQGISGLQREACRSYILAAASSADLTCN